MVKPYKDKSFWLETAGDCLERPPLTGAHRADVCIIGGGFTGLSAALHLRQLQPALDVAVLESDVVGYGASGRNAGFCMTLFGLSLEVTKLFFGLERAKEADDYMVRAAGLVGRLVEEHSIACDYQETGLLTVATNPGQQRRLETELELATRAGLHAMEWLDGPTVRSRVDSPTYLGARHDPVCALLNPARLARGMARAAEAAGAVIYERSPVTAVHPGRLVEVRTDQGSIMADKVIFAANGFSARFPQLRSKQLPAHTYIALTEPLTPEQLTSIGWTGREGIEDGRNLIHYYRLTADNRLLFGGDDAVYYFGNRDDRDCSPQLQCKLERTVRETFPGLREVRFSHHWGGPVSVTLDMIPALGRIGSNMLYSLGCMGHGVAMTHLNGATLADLALERCTDLTEVFFVNRAIVPVPPEPLRFAVAQTLRTGFQLWDAWDERNS